MLGSKKVESCNGSVAQSPAAAASEVMLRYVLDTHPRMAVLLLEAECHSRVSKVSHQQVAAHYGVPFMAYADMLRPSFTYASGPGSHRACNRTSDAWRMWRSLLHPNGYTHQLITDGLAAWWWHFMAEVRLVLSGGALSEAVEASMRAVPQGQGGMGPDGAYGRDATKGFARGVHRMATAHSAKRRERREAAGDDAWGAVQEVGKEVVGTPVRSSPSGEAMPPELTTAAARRDFGICTPLSVYDARVIHESNGPLQLANSAATPAAAQTSSGAGEGAGKLGLPPVAQARDVAFEAGWGFRVVQGNWSLYEDRAGKPGFITTGPRFSTIEFQVAFGAQPRISLVYDRSYEGFGKVRRPRQLALCVPPEYLTTT